MKTAQEEHAPIPEGSGVRSSRALAASCACSCSTEVQSRRCMWHVWCSITTAEHRNVPLEPYLIHSCMQHLCVVEHFHDNSAEQKGKEFLFVLSLGIAGGKVSTAAPSPPTGAFGEDKDRKSVV